MFVAGPEGGLAAARDWDVDVLLVGKDGRLHTSAGLRALLG